MDRTIGGQATATKGGDRLDDWFVMGEHGLREPYELENGVCLSVQASEHHYCSPRVMLPSLHDYASVEVAAWSETVDRLTPEHIPALAKWWHGDDVAGWVPVTDIPEIMQILRAAP